MLDLKYGNTLQRQPQPNREGGTVANPNPIEARRAKRQRAKPGNLQDVAGMLWEALEAARELLGEADPQIRLKAVHALSQTASSFARVYEAGELEARIEALEQQQERKAA